MPVNIPYKVRAALYIFTLVGSPIVAYLQARGTIGPKEVTLWLAEVSAVAALAAFNTVPTRGEDK